MENFNVIVVDCNAKEIININIEINSYVNQIYSNGILFKLYFHCCFKLLYNSRVIEPYEKINDITTDQIIIFNIVSYPKLKFFTSNLNFNIAVNTDGKIIDWIIDYSYYVVSILDNFYFLKTYLNNNYNCHNIIKICSTESHAGILFEDGLLIILSYKFQTIINTFNNVTKIVKTYNSIGFIINNNKLITFMSLVKDKIYEIKDLDKKEYININANYDFFFIICKKEIIVIHQIYSYNNNSYTNHMQLIDSYKITNIIEIYDTYDSQLIAAIKEDGYLISFEILTTWMESPNNKLSIKPLEYINKLELKIKKIVCISFSFVSLTYNNSVFIWGNNKELIDIFQILQNELIDVIDIVSSHEYIGILRKNNSIIVISLTGVYKMYNNSCKYDQIISTNYQIFALCLDNKVYQIPNPQESINEIKLYNDIKEVYANNISILVISNDNIVYAYNSYVNYIYYKQQHLDLLAIKINQYYFLIISNNGNLIEIKYDDKKINNSKTFRNILKFIEM